MPESSTQRAGQVPIDLIYLNMLAFDSADHAIRQLQERVAAAKSIEELPSEEDVEAAAICAAGYLQPDSKQYACTLSKHSHPIHVAHVMNNEAVFAWVDVPA